MVIQIFLCFYRTFSNMQYYQFKITNSLLRVCFNEMNHFPVNENSISYASLISHKSDFIKIY